MKLSLFLIFFCFTAEAVSLDEIRTLAIDRSPLLSAQEFETRAVRSDVSWKGKWGNPQLMTQWGTLKTGSAKPGVTAELSLTQPVPLSDKYSLRRELAEVAVKQQEANTIYYKNWVAHQAVLSAWRVFATRELYRHGEERTKRLRLVKSYVETRPRVSIKHRVELSLIEATLLELSKDLDLKAHELRVAMSDLEFWTGKKLTAEELRLSIPDFQLLTIPSSVDINKDPELHRADLTKKMASLDKEIARKERRPDLFLGGGYRVESVVPQNHFMYGIVGLNIPIWDTGFGRAQAAGARLRRDEKNYEETKRRVELKQNKQLELVNYQLEQVKRFPPKTVHKNERAIHEAEAGFKQGVLDVNTFLLMETQSHEVIDHVFISWVEYLNAVSELALMKGEDLKW
ncbi:MAG: TolC family protein [Bacteriovoracaceae bacterium]